MARGLGTLCLIIGVVGVLLAFIPWLTCAQAYPSNAAELAQILSVLGLALPVDPGTGGLQEAASMCLNAYPPSGERLPLAGGLGAMALGVVLRFVGKAPPAPPEELPELARSGPLIAPDHDSIEPRRSDLSPEEMDEGIDLDEELGLGGESGRFDADQDETLMDQVVDQVRELEVREAARVEEEATVDGFFCPSGMSHAPRLHVDPGHEGARDDEEPGRGESVERPFRTIGAALDRAKALAREAGEPVQVRLAPGIYQEALRVPSRVMLVNHRMPAEGDFVGRLRWLMAQQDVDAQDRVTILAPAEAEQAVFFLPGNTQGLFGCHVVAREATEQVGVVATRCDGVLVANCSIEGFRRGGARIAHCGSDLSVGGIQFLGCRFQSNRQSRGGAVRAEQSAILCDGCLFLDNRARCGGAIWAQELRSPLTVRRCEFKHNLARAPASSLPQESPILLDPVVWEDLHGVGGAIWMAGSRLKLDRCELRENGASAGGGGLALFGCKALLHGKSQDEPLLFKSCRARTGGAILAAAAHDEPSIIRAANLLLERNIAQEIGGAVALCGAVTCQMTSSQLEYNQADEQDGLGGAVGIFGGAELLGLGLLFRANRAAEAGAILARNGSLRLKDHVIFQDNEACAGQAGALRVDTVEDPRLERLVARGDLKMPFVLKLLDVEMVGNLAARCPAAVAVGRAEGDEAMPLGLEFGEAVRLRANRVKGERARPGEHLIVAWRGSRVLDDQELEPGKRVLR